MRIFWFVLLLSGSFLLAQDSTPANTQQDAKAYKGEVTVQGCLGRSSGDYILTKQDPGVTYELHATGKTRLHDYMGQRVEVIGKESPTMSSSSDALNKTGSASSVTINVRLIRTVDKECVAR